MKAATLALGMSSRGEGMMGSEDPVDEERREDEDEEDINGEGGEVLTFSLPLALVFDAGTCPPGGAEDEEAEAEGVDKEEGAGLEIVFGVVGLGREEAEPAALRFEEGPFPPAPPDEGPDVAELDPVVGMEDEEAEETTVLTLPRGFAPVFCFVPSPPSFVPDADVVVVAVVVEEEDADDDDDADES